MKLKNARIIAGFVLMGLGWIGIIYGIVVEVEGRQRYEECKRNESCWEFEGAQPVMSPYTLGGIILLGIGAVVFVSGKRAAQKKMV